MTGRTALGAAVLLAVLGAAAVVVGQRADVAGVTVAAAGEAPAGPAASRAGTASDLPALARTLPVGGQAPAVHARGWLNAAARTGPDPVGAAFAATWTPCVGPLLGAPLVTAGAGSDPVTGGGLLAAYSAGLAVPFLSFCLAASAAGGALPGLARRLGRHAVTAQRVAGGLLVLLGLLLVGGRPGWVALLPAGG